MSTSSMPSNVNREHENGAPELPIPGFGGVLQFSGNMERGSQVLLHLGEEQGYAAALEIDPSRYRHARLTGALPSVDRVLLAVEDVASALSEVGKQRTTVIGIGDGTPLAQALTALSPDLVRRLVLINPQARVNPSLITLLLDKVEHTLPIGLPLRPLSNSFDSRPLLHRIRCPVLILCTPNATPYQLAQAKLLAQKIPNSWLKTMDRTALSTQIEQFLAVPAKRPQKNLS